MRDTLWLLWGLYVYTRSPLLDCERHSLTDLRFILVTSAAWAMKDTVWLIWGLYVYTRRPHLGCERHNLTDLRFILVTCAAWAMRDTVWLIWGLYSWPLLPGLWETQSDWSGGGGGGGDELTIHVDRFWTVRDSLLTIHVDRFWTVRDSLTALRFIPVDRSWTVRDTVWLLWGLSSGIYALNYRCLFVGVTSVRVVEGCTFSE